MTNPPTPSTNAPMQFDRAVNKDGAAKGPGVVCSMCNRSIVEKYWTLGDQPTCISCKSKTEREAAKAKGAGTFAWSAFYGFGAAIGGAILYYAVIKILNLEMALVAIAIGYMVGYAMRKGANGWGGKRFQIAAVGLTYLSVGMAYVPLVLEGARDAKKAAKATADSLRVVAAAAAEDDSANAADPMLVAIQDSTAIGDSSAVLAIDSTAAADSTIVAEDSAAAPAADSAIAPTKDSIFSGSSGGFLKVILGFIGAFLFAMSLPLLYIIGTLPGGLISALIIFFGMRQAWRMTAGNDLTFQGPLTIPK
jgi:hypothetical protein